jgi:hypothetical protein
LAKIAENCGHNIGSRLLRKKLAVSGEDGKATISSFVRGKKIATKHCHLSTTFLAGHNCVFIFKREKKFYCGNHSMNISTTPAG